MQYNYSISTQLQNMELFIIAIFSKILTIVEWRYTYNCTLPINKFNLFYLEMESLIHRIL